MAMTTIRSAEPRDYPAFARLFPELEVDEPVPAEERWHKTILAGMVLAEVGERAVGYVFYETLGDLSYIRNVVSDPAHRRSGIGRALMTEVARRARAAGSTRWALNVKPDNVAAIRLYESLGFEAAYEGETVRVRWDAIDPLEAGDVRAVELAPDDDAAFERALSIEAGLLASRRAKGSVVVATTRAGRPTGAASFDRQFPGSYPFKAESRAEAGALLRAMRERRLEISDSGTWRENGVQIFVQNAPYIRDALLSIGAAVVLRILHMTGPLPGP
jgi:ribosomal protein S18 acetylase RimI-like enzyme